MHGATELYAIPGSMRLLSFLSHLYTLVVSGLAAVVLRPLVVSSPSPGAFL